MRARFPWPMAAVPALCLALLLAAGTVEARSLSKTLARTGLAPQDMTLMTATADRLFDPAPQAGQHRDWSNPESGSTGTVRILSVDGDCAVLLHEFHAAGRDRAQSVEMRRCRDAQGAWVAR